MRIPCGTKLSGNLRGQEVTASGQSGLRNGSADPEKASGRGGEGNQSYGYHVRNTLTHESLVAGLTNIRSNGPRLLLGVSCVRAVAANGDVSVAGVDSDGGVGS